MPVVPADHLLRPALGRAGQAGELLRGQSTLSWDGGWSHDQELAVVKLEHWKVKSRESKPEGIGHLRHPESTFSALTHLLHSSDSEFL